MSKKDNSLYCVTKTFTTYIISLMFGCLDGTFESWLRPFNDLLIKSTDTISSYVEHQLIIFIYKSSLVFHCVNYCFYESISIARRIAFIFYICLIAYRLKWTLTYENLKLAKIIGIPDASVVIIINCIINSNNPEEFYHINTFYIISLAFYPSKTKLKYASIGVIAILYCYFHVIQAGKSLQSVLALSTTYGFIICMGYAYIAISKEFSKKLLIVKKETEVKLQNNNMLLASISHDLKNPLNSILGCVDLLKSSENLTPHERDFLLTASYSGKIMTYLIANILDVAKMAKGKFDIDRVPMNISEVLEKVISIEKELARVKKINLHKRILTKLPKFVYGDEMRLSQILMNLIGNAIKFTSKGYAGFVLAWASSIEEAKARENFEKAIIPPEEYFLTNQLSNSTSKENEEVWNFDIEELKDPLSNKMKKYVDTPRITLRSIIKTALRINADTKESESNKRKVTSYSSGNLRKDKKMRLVQNIRNHSLFKESRHCSSCSQEGIPTEDDSGLLIIDVIDTGIGVTEEEQKTLFEPFKQANSSVKAKYGGTGLGLWITKQLVYLMSGFIESKSIPNKGSRFTITLPFKVVRGKQANSFSETNVKKDSNIELSLFKQENTLRNLRNDKILAMIGKNKILDQMKILIIENENHINDSILKQILNQLKDTDCCLTHCFHSNALEMLKGNDYEFEAVIIIAPKKLKTFIQLANDLKKKISENCSRLIPLCIAAGNLYMKCR